MPIKAGFMVPHPPLIIPSVGRGNEHVVDLTIASYEKVGEKICLLSPETIIITSPHALLYRDYFHISPGEKASGSFERFAAPQERFSVTYDTELVKAISDIADENLFPAGTEGDRMPELDHGTMLPLYFIEKAYKKAGKPCDFKVVRIGLSGFPLDMHFRFGRMISEAVDLTGRSCVFVASGDLSHKLQPDGPYGFDPAGPVYDEKIMDVMGRAAFRELVTFDEKLCDEASECGHRSFTIMGGALSTLRVRTEKLSHQDVTGVGYGICCYTVIDENEDISGTASGEESEADMEGTDMYVELAKKAVEYSVKNKRVLPERDYPDGLPPEIKSDRAGAFVSIHENGELRGCIGTFLPCYGCIADEIAANAKAASLEDPRFSPISEDELSSLEINVDILSKPVPVSSVAELDPKKYGVIVTDGFRRGLLLPDLEGVDTIEMQLGIAKRKAGIPLTEEVAVERFTVERHK